MIKTHTKEDRPEEILTILMILDRQEEDHPEEDHPEEDHLDHPKEEGYQIGNSDIQEEDCPDPLRDPQEDCRLETPETIEIKTMDSDST